jgi:hypothetical protein
MSDLVWHYTTGDKFIAICDSGVLLQTSVGLSGKEKPVLWFSKNQKWEPTANKICLSPDGKMIPLDQNGTANEGNGLVRFGLKKKNVLHWPALIKAARISKTTVQSLEAAGVKQGANPSDWYGSLKSVQVDTCDAIEVMNQNGEWIRVMEDGQPLEGNDHHE